MEIFGDSPLDLFTFNSRFLIQLSFNWGQNLICFYAKSSWKISIYIFFWFSNPLLFIWSKFESEHWELLFTDWFIEFVAQFYVIKFDLILFISIPISFNLVHIIDWLLFIWFRLQPTLFTDSQNQFSCMFHDFGYS